MTKESNFYVGGMHIELFLPSEQVQADAIIIPELPHGSNIVMLASGNEEVGECDALMTENRNLLLGIRTADCAPVCLSDGKMTGIAHVGWRGLCSGLVEKMLGQFDRATLDVYVAPFLHSFEIQRDFCFERITEKFYGQFLEEKYGRIFFHFGDALRSLLPPHTVYDARDTGTDTSFPSHRRNGTRERFVTTVSFR